jgi:glutamate N-acetyltransferase/amino-acid N-acetyltransferase
MPEELESPEGFRFAAVSAGIRKGGSADLGLIVSERAASAAAVFTTNRVAAAPVLLSKRHLAASRGLARAIVVNAGNANCATPNGIRVAERTAAHAARLLGIARRQVLVASTGVIGIPLDEKAIPAALPAALARLAPGAFEDVARAIMTTDTRPKLAFRRVAAGRGSFARVLGMAKGAGMIHPRLATMLAFVLTDAGVSAAALKRITSAAATRTFNRISVDGDTSTNDTVFVLANGLAGRVPEARLAAAIEEVMGDLAVAIAADGEGARKLIKIEVAGARNEAQAEQVARSIANSPLVKTAMAGGDPNWGRILSAAGVAGVALDPAQVSIVLNGTTVCRRGLAAPFDDSELGKQLAAAREIDILVSIGHGRRRVRFWTCDLTEDYIRINASYRT